MLLVPVLDCHPISGAELGEKETGWYMNSFYELGNSLVPQTVKHLPTMRETQVQSLSQDLLEKEMATHSSIPAWRIPWMDEPGRLQSLGLQRVRHDSAALLSLSQKPRGNLSKEEASYQNKNKQVSLLGLWLEYNYRPAWGYLIYWLHWNS